MACHLYVAEFSTAPWLLFDAVALSMCSVTAREGLCWFMLCPVLSAQRAFLVYHPHMKSWPSFQIRYVQCVGVVWWIYGPVAYCAFGSWVCEIPASLILPSLCLPAVMCLVSSFLGASWTLLAQSQREKRGIISVTKICGVTQALGTLSFGFSHASLQTVAGYGL